MSEALAAVIAFGFEQLRVRTLLADIDVPNVRSRSLFTRLGFVPMHDSTTYFALSPSASGARHTRGLEDIEKN